MKEITHKIHPWKYGAMPRKLEIVMCRLRIGHTRLTHGYVMNREYEPYCHDCIVPLTIRHLLVECPSLGELRNQFLLDCIERDGNFSMVKILGDSVEFPSGVLNFLSEAGLLEQI